MSKVVVSILTPVCFASYSPPTSMRGTRTSVCAVENTRTPTDPARLSLRHRYFALAFTRAKQRSSLRKTEPAHELRCVGIAGPSSACSYCVKPYNSGLLVAVRLLSSSGAQRTIEDADSARLDEPYFVLSRCKPGPQPKGNRLDAAIRGRCGPKSKGRSQKALRSENWRRRPDLNRGWRFCRFRWFSILLIRLALWSLVFPGFRWCLGVNGPKFGPNFFEPAAYLADRRRVIRYLQTVDDDYCYRGSNRGLATI